MVAAPPVTGPTPQARAPPSGDPEGRRDHPNLTFDRQPPLSRRDDAPGPDAALRDLRMEVLVEQLRNQRIYMVDESRC